MSTNEMERKAQLPRLAFHFVGAPADLVRQLPVLLGGMAVYALEVWLAYRKSAARFEKVDL